MGKQARAADRRRRSGRSRTATSSMARDLVRQDDVIDNLNREIFQHRARDRRRRRPARVGDDMMLVARAIERIGDNAVDIGEQIAFVVTGLFREFEDASHPGAGRALTRGSTRGDPEAAVFIWLSSSATSLEGGAAMRVLIVEDEVEDGRPDPPRPAQGGHGRRRRRKGEDALWMAGSTEYDAIVLDLMLPGHRRLRGLPAPARRRRLVADPDADRARRACADRVAGLDGGADDYLTKPFSYAELLARLRALARRGAGRAPAGARGRRPAPRPGHAAGLAGRGRRSSSRPRSSRCSRPSCAGPGEVLSRFQLLEHAWDYEYENRSNIVDSYVRLPAPRRSTGRSASSRSRPCAAPATGCARTADAMSRTADPAAGDPGLRRW